MRLRDPSRPPRGWSVALSLAVHALIASGVLLLAVRGLEKADEREAEAAKLATVPLVGHPDGLVNVDTVPEQTGVPPTFAGGADIARIDTGRFGKGGESADEAARHLADRDDGLRATPESSTLHRDDQVQRIDSARHRSSWEDRRSTTRPMELSFVVTGKGQETERRTQADVDPARGVIASRAPQHEGQPLSGTLAEGEGPAASQLGGRAAPGAGVRNGNADGPHRAVARVAFARPDLPQAKVSVPAAEHGKVRDDVDSRQAVASAVEAIVHASYAGGDQGSGQGGTRGGGSPGAGGAQGEGSHPRPLGAGAGDWIDFDTTDPALASYFRRLKAKMNPALARAFPKQAALDLKQGFVIVELMIDRAGVINPKLLRPSGIDEYDRNCMSAIRGITPEPLPTSIAQSSLRVRGRFEAANPVVK